MSAPADPVIDWQAFFTNPPATVAASSVVSIFHDLNGGRPDQALERLAVAKAALAATEYACHAQAALLPPEYLAEAVASGANPPALSACLRLYAEFLGLPLATVATSIAQQGPRLLQRWRECVPDEDAVTAEQLDRYYGSLAFLDICISHLDIAGGLGLALKGFIGSLAAATGGSLCDFGGGIGDIASIAVALGAPEAVLVEPNPASRAFAAWRNERCGTAKVRCLDGHDLTAEQGRHDLVVCSDVLEHVLDPYAVAAAAAALAKPGGLIFSTTSFALYPHTSHLKCNVALAGHDDEIWQAAGCSHFAMTTPFRMLDCWRFYRRQR